jgi:hypothetical protein
MTVRIKCTTCFDITETGVKNRFHKSDHHFTDQAGQKINNDLSWQRSRNQQCNWETINQIISLRTLPENITSPVCKDYKWTFEFDVVDPSSVEQNGDPVGILKDNCNGVPMITGLTEQHVSESMLMTGIENENIWFEIIA